MAKVLWRMKHELEFFRKKTVKTIAEINTCVTGRAQGAIGTVQQGTKKAEVRKVNKKNELFEYEEAAPTEDAARGYPKAAPGGRWRRVSPADAQAPPRQRGVGCDVGSWPP